MAKRKTEELHAHRWSAAGVRYFVTLCTSDHRGCLTARSVQKVILEGVQKSDALGDTETFAFVVMPDHMHWLLRLGDRLSLGRTIARFKAQSRPALASDGLRWQRDFFERRLRQEERSEDYGRYIFLNPYRAGLLELDKRWAGWWCPHPRRFEFLAMLNPDDSVPREWLAADGDNLVPEIHTGRE